MVTNFDGKSVRHLKGDDVVAHATVFGLHGAVIY